MYESDVESKYLVYAPFPKPSDDNYSGQKPQFIEGDVFRIIVPLDDHNYDFVMNCVAENYIDNNPTANTFRIDC